MIHVVAILKAKPGQHAALLEKTNANLAAVRGEEGCIEYGPARDAPFSPAKFGEDAVIVLEKWASAEALAAHGKTAHMAAFGAAIRDLLAERPAVHILEAV